MYLIKETSRYRSVVFVALLHGMLLNGCGKPQAAPEKAGRATNVPERVCPFPESELEQRLVQWALGCEAMRQSSPRSSAAVTISQGTSYRARTCVAASSLLPSRDGRKIFAAGGETLFVIDMPDGKPVPVPLAATHGWRFSRLLAIERGAGPLAILAEMARGQGSQQAYGLWRIEVGDNRATARQLTAAEQPGDARAFFARYLVPRCEHDDERCIVTVNKGSGAGKARIEIRRGGLTETPLEVPAGTNGIIDAAWMPGSAGDMVLLVDVPNC